jgi:hypothetical protein
LDALLDAVKKPVSFCSCEGIVTVLLKNGLFPGAPSQPHVAISIAILDFHQALFERSCEAVNALVSALTSHYRRRGFPIRNANVSITCSLTDMEECVTVF